MTRNNSASDLELTDEEGSILEKSAIDSSKARRKKEKEEKNKRGKVIHHHKDKHSEFKVYESSVKADGKCIKQQTIHILGSQLMQALLTVGYCNDGKKELITQPEELFPFLDDLKGETRANVYSRSLIDNPFLKTNAAPLVSFLEDVFHKEKEIIRNMVKQGRIEFKRLWGICQPGAEVVIQDDVTERLIGMKVVSYNYFKNIMSSFVIIKGNVIKSDGVSFFEHMHTITIRKFEGAWDFDELQIRPLDSKTRMALTKRGRKFRKYAFGFHFLSYSGNIFKRSWFSKVSTRAKGRVMVDITSFGSFNPDYETYKKTNNYNSPYMYNPDGTPIQQQLTSIEDEQLWMTYPTLGGFSFAAKTWGELYVDLLRPVQWDDKSFDMLVLDAKKKEIIKALVMSNRTSGTDIIRDKGANQTFLLHGPTGTGKTLTAESISEYLHRPLYSVSVGELGTTPGELELKLQKILDVASIWNAVILIDEADIFLEQRDSTNIVRNAMVGIFLRLLEYHKGTMFLTSNRVSCFDAAFHSRISLSLYYPELNEEARKKVWMNFLPKQTNVDIDFDVLASFELNGRQIRAITHITKSLFESRKEITTELIQEIIQIHHSFDNNKGIKQKREEADSEYTV